MPTKKVNYNKDKAVIVRVYAEKPRNRKKRSSSSSSSLVQQHHHHHHVHYHIHHTLKQEVVHGHGSNIGYDRKAGLLRYSHLLRESARRPLLPSSSSSTSTSLLTMSANNNLQPTPTQMTTSNKTLKYAGRLGCFGNWKLLMPSCLRPWSNAPKKKKKKQENGVFSGNGMRILQVRIRSFIPNVFSRSRKRA